MFTTPILYLVFNRPLETSKSFEILRKLKPAKLYIAADGARQHRPDDIANTEKVRALVSNVDWDCEVITLFQTANLGCRKGVEAALKWFFDNEAEGIILEDDIIPNATFFEFCKAMLDKYRDDTSIFSINGCSINYQNPSESYGLTRYFNMWGWATWRRTYELVQHTWKDFNPGQPLKENSNIRKVLHLPVPFGGNEKWLRHWQQIFTDTYNGKIDTWDHQWVYTAFKLDKYCIRPAQNYIVNIGFGETATHHTFTKSPICNLKYTADSWQDQAHHQPAVDYKYEVEYVCKIVNSVEVTTWKQWVFSLVPAPLKKAVKKII